MQMASKREGVKEKNRDGIGNEDSFELRRPIDVFFSNHVSSICNAMDIPHLVTTGAPERWMRGGRHIRRGRGAEFNLHPRLPDLHEAVADVLQSANLTSARTAVVFAAGSRERSLRALLLQDALLTRGFDCLASEIRLEHKSVRQREMEGFPF